MPSKPGEEPAGTELIASLTFCSLTIKLMSPGLEGSGKKISRDGEGCFFLVLQIAFINSEKLQVLRCDFLRTKPSFLLNFGNQ
jgi:hypothetical protein